MAGIWSHTGHWAKCSTYIFSWILTARIDGWGNQGKERLSNLPKLAQQRSRRNRFVLKSGRHQSLWSEFLAHAPACTPAFPNSCCSLLDQSLAVSGCSVKFSWIIIFNMKTDSEHYALIHIVSLLETLFIHNYFVYLQNIKWFFKIYLSDYVQYERLWEKPPACI